MPNDDRKLFGGEIQSEKESRWRYVIRHPEFRRELRELRAFYNVKGALEAENQHKEFVERWGLGELPHDMLTKAYIPDEIAEKNQFYEEFCHSAPLCPPVQADVEPVGYTTPSGVHRGEFVSIKVDLSYPDSLILSAIADELRAIRGDNPRRRHHRDKTDAYLEVYDRAEKGETYEMMALTLGEKIPTLKSRLRVACRKIYGNEHIPPKWKLLTIGMDAATHLNHCTQCQKANFPEEMCVPGHAFVTQDTSSQVELADDDIIRQATAPDHTDESLLD